jgi:hypothetical protein
MNDENFAAFFQPPIKGKIKYKNYINTKYILNKFEYEKNIIKIN